MSETKQPPTEADLKVAGEVQESISKAQEQATAWLAQSLREVMSQKGFKSTAEVEALSNEEIGDFIETVESKYREKVAEGTDSRNIPAELAQTRIGTRVELNKMLKKLGARTIAPISRQQV